MSERKKISFAHGQELSPDDAPALPLWVDGHAYLLMAERFHDVVDGAGKVLRRVPLYGDDAVDIAVPSSERAVPAWRTADALQREDNFRKLHELLTRYRGHLARLISEESGFSNEQAEAELEQALASVGEMAGSCPTASNTEPANAGSPGHSAGHAGGVAAVLGDAQAPLAGPLMCALEALAAGWGVVLKPGPVSPSPLFATAELFTRAGFPKGIVNCVHGDEAAVRALCSHPGVSALSFCGAPALAGRVAAIAQETGRRHAVGGPGEKLRSDWRRCLGLVD